ncbi:MAG: hypothetical protein RMK18_00010 [Armatimonadota bacterium]|nr:hypothetical protein [Armatimonadota bacterium]MCX7776442.1 hypothetical protein [Armatimonadota bacterium]MDW8024240.1 hypothetical protein [Armatimonadota bacterium]
MLFGIAIALLISIGYINMLVFILLKSRCSDAQMFKALALQWVKLQCALYGLILLGWIGWHTCLWALGEAGQSEVVRITLAFVVFIPGVVMLIYLRRWIGSIGQAAHEQKHEQNKESYDERGDKQ